MQVLCPRPQEHAAIRTDLNAIFVSLELSRSTWVITSLAPGGGEKMSKHSVRSGDIAGLLARLSQLTEKARARTGHIFPIIVIQEAGLDGFWIHRVLQKEGIESHVVDPASIATSRRRRRAKTDTIDGEALVRALLAYKRGEPRVCAMVKAPTPQEEDRRRISRDRLELLIEQVKAVEAERDAWLARAQASPGVPAPAALLLALRGVGPEAAARLWSEGLFRTFTNRKQVAAYAGLAPTPWHSGSVHREQGVSKAGNPRLRTIMIQIAWLWLRHQPHSALAVWFHERIKRKGGRLGKTMIVALARKLLIALWKYATAGVLMEGAVLKHA